MSRKKRMPPDFVKGIAAGRIRLGPGANIDFGNVEDAEEKRKTKRRRKNAAAKRARKENRAR